MCFSFVVHKLDSAVQKLMKRGQSKWGGVKGRSQKTLVQLLHGCIIISYFTNYERKTHQTPVCIFYIIVEVQILSPFLLGYFNVC